MTVVTYRLVGKAKTADLSYIPSLIGHTVGATSSDDDAYFELEELPDEALEITAIATTKWVNYDSLPAERPDPIVAVRAGNLAYYSTVSELTAALEAAGLTQTLRMLAVAQRSLRA